MKKTLITTFACALLLLALSPAVGTKAAQDMDTTPSTLKQLTLTFELQDLPGRAAAESFWEVSYQWRIADQRDFDRWSIAGEDQAAQNSLGVLLSKHSFTRRNLSDIESRRFSVAVPVKGELLKRMKNAGQRPQIVWLNATVRIRDGKLGTDVIKRVNPVWGPYFYRQGVANVRMELTKRGTITWSAIDIPTRGGGKQTGLSVSRIP
jgi:hypothetical protein